MLGNINPYAALSWASVVISFLTFVATQLTSRRREGGDYVDRIEARVSKLETDLKECRSHAKNLLEENIELLRRIANIHIDSSAK